MGLRGTPLHARTQRAPFDHDDLARIEPADGIAPAARGEEGGEQAAGPQFAEAGDPVLDVASRGAHERNGLQQALQVGEVRAQRSDIGGACLVRQQFGRDPLVTEPQPVERRGAGGLVVALGLRDEPDQFVGDALAGREDQRDTPLGEFLDDRGDAAKAIGVGKARAAELMHDPAFSRLRHECSLIISQCRVCTAKTTGNLPVRARETQASRARDGAEDSLDSAASRVPVPEQPGAAGQPQQPEQYAHGETIRARQGKRAVQWREQRRSRRASRSTARARN